MAPVTREHHLGLLVSLCLAMAVWVACGGESDEKGAGAPAAPAAAAKSAPMAPEADEATLAEPDEAEGEEDLVELPADVPHYPGSKLAESQGQDELGVSVTLESSDDAQTIARFYAAELRLKDWVIQETPADEGLAIFADKGSRSLTVMISPAPGGSEIGILVLDMQ
jgi:hypothetical protein